MCTNWFVCEQEVYWSSIVINRQANKPWTVFLKWTVDFSMIASHDLLFVEPALD